MLIRLISHSELPTGVDMRMNGSRSLGLQPPWDPLWEKAVKMMDVQMKGLVDDVILQCHDVQKVNGLHPWSNASARHKGDW